MTTENRIAFLDITRVIAIFMVLIIHSCEFFYIGTRTFTVSEIFWANLIDSALRIAVPIFIMVTSYLLVPTNDSMELFYKKRLPKILIPFFIWSVVYASLPALWGAFPRDQILSRLLRIPYMFNDGHLWYIYMYIGIILFIPIINPWIKIASKKQLQIFLGLWFFSSFHHYIKFFADTNEWISIFGECKWNEFSTFWNFSGYIGYVVLAYYIRKYINWNKAKTLTIGSICFLLGWTVAFLWFKKYYHTGDLYVYEIAWRYCTPNVILASFGVFIMMKSINYKTSHSYIQEISKSAFGIYLCHILILNVINSYLNFLSSTPLKIVLYATLCLLCSYIVIKVLSYLPCGKYLSGR